MTLPELSVFYPSYNETGNIERVVRRALEILPGVAQRFEVIVVDDGSTDGTGALADRLAAEDARVRVVHHGVNRGYGAAVKSGLEASRYRYVFFSDGDGQFDIAEITVLLPLIGKAGIAAGYRIKRMDPIHRTLNAALYHLLIFVLFGLRHRDIDCAFKLIRREVLDAVTLKSDGALISAELLVRARNAGFSIAQAGVHHYPRMAGRQTGATLSVILRMFKEVWAFRRELRPKGGR